MHHHEDLHDADLAPIAERLRTNRPQLTALELDEVRRQVRARVAASPARRRTRSEFMKSRLAILSTLVLGLLFSTTGAGLAVSGFSGNHSSAATVQYNPGDRGDVGGESGGGGNGGNGGNTNTLQTTRQVEAGAGTGTGSGNLPFTGYAAIPVLLGGVALLSAGLVMRRRSHDS
jgi:hypothetical protein